LQRNTPTPRRKTAIVPPTAAPTDKALSPLVPSADEFAVEGAIVVGITTITIVVASLVNAVGAKGGDRAGGCVVVSAVSNAVGDNVAGIVGNSVGVTVGDPVCAVGAIVEVCVGSAEGR
jgi:hypothetical protein